VALIICNGCFIAEIWKKLNGRTSSGAELAGVLEAARYFRKHKKDLCPPFKVYTDSLEVVYGYANQKVFSPKTYKKDWVELISLGKSLGVEIIHIKGHSTGNGRNPNKVCDALAKTVCGMDSLQGSDT